MHLVLVCTVNLGSAGMQLIVIFNVASHWPTML